MLPALHHKCHSESLFPGLPYYRNLLVQCVGNAAVLITLQYAGSTQQTLSAMLCVLLADCWHGL